MDATTKPPSSRRHSHRGQRKYREATEGDPGLPTSESVLRQDRPDVSQLRQVRADFYNKPPEQRRKQVEEAMARDEPPRRSSASKVKEERSPEVVVRRVHRHSLDHPPRRRKPREGGYGGGGEHVYVYRSQPSDADRHPPLRRSKTTIPSSRSHGERKQRDERGAHRSNTDWGISHTRGEETMVKRTPHTNRLDSRYRAEEHYRHPPVIRSASMRETPTTPIRRPSVHRSQTTSRKVRPTFYPTPTATSPIAGIPERATSISGKSQRPSSFLGSIFGAPRAPPTPEKQVECLTCLSPHPISRTALLPCKHRMCHACLKRIFTLSITDPQHMPPRCCNPTQHIPLKHVDKLFDLKFKMRWNAKYQEYTTKNRIYCPRRGCGEWIKPGNIHVDMSGGTQGGRKYAKCGRCRMKVCVACNGKWHTSRTCPKDDATRQFIEIAQREGWQRCYNCSATVELKEGCNHMTCRCKAEFCMICGMKWKSCDCPWFNYEAVEQDRLLHMNVPGARRVVIDAATPEQARGYQAEMEARREQERRDEALARRMAVLGLDNPGVEMYQVDAGDDEDFAVGNAARHHLNTHYRREEAPGPEEPPAPPLVLRQHSLASRQYNNRRSTRPSERVVPRRVATDYVSEVQRHAPVEVDWEAGGAVGGHGGVPRRARPTAEAGEVRRHSVLAGLTGGGTAEGRVAEWRQYVET